jgi:hypothetical protein
VARLLPKAFRFLVDLTERVTVGLTVPTVEPVPVVHDFGWSVNLRGGFVSAPL